jgi:regulator of replication initiation timing
LEKEQILNQFDQIEKRIGGLIEASKSLEATNEELKKRIESLEEELERKSQNELSFLEEKNLIRSKVDNLLMRLQEISETSK